MVLFPYFKFLTPTCSIKSPFTLHVSSDPDPTDTNNKKCPAFLAPFLQWLTMKKGRGYHDVSDAQCFFSSCKKRTCLFLHHKRRRTMKKLQEKEWEWKGYHDMHMLWNEPRPRQDQMRRNGKVRKGTTNDIDWIGWTHERTNDRRAPFKEDGKWLGEESQKSSLRVHSERRKKRKRAEKRRPKHTHFSPLDADADPRRIRVPFFSFLFFLFYFIFCSNFWLSEN